MKKMMLAMFCMLCLSAQAQTSPAAKARVAETRKAYAEAKKKIATAEQLQKEGKPSNMTVVNSNYALRNEQGKVTTNYYYTCEEDTLLGRYFYEPFFIVNSYSAPGNIYYQEFLFDKDLGLIFYYEKNNGKETRFYFGKEGEVGDEGLVYEINTHYRVMEPTFACRVGGELMNAFHYLMNREF